MKIHIENRQPYLMQVPMVKEGSSAPIVDYVALGSRGVIKKLPEGLTVCPKWRTRSTRDGLVAIADYTLAPAAVAVFTAVVADTPDDSPETGE